MGLHFGSRLLLAREPVDFRKGADGLARIVERACGGKPFSGDIFVFRPKGKADRIRLITWDGSGLVMAQKRLEQGRFFWPEARDATVSITPAQWGLLIEGLEWQKVVTPIIRAPQRAG